MSNDLVPQQLSIPSNQMGELEPMEMGLMGLGTDSLQQISMSNMGVGPVGSGYNGSASQQMSMSNMEIGLLQPISNNLGSQILPLSNQQTGQMNLQTYNMVSQQYFLPNGQLGELGTMSNNVASQQVSLLNKRKAPMEPSVMQKSSMPNKRLAQVEHRPWLQQIITPDKRFVQQVQFMPNSPGSQHVLTSNKKVVQKESVLSKSVAQKQSMLKSQSAHMQSSAMIKTDQFGSVRSKMRENLASALSLVSQDKSLNAEKSSQNDAASSLGKMQVNSQPDGFLRAASDVVEAVSAEAKESLPSKEGSTISLDDQNATQGNFYNGNTSADMQARKCNRLDFQYGNLLPDEDASFSDNFFVRDELLQGNGLSWVLEPEIAVAGEKENPTTEKQEVKNEKMDGDGGRGEQPPDQSPQILASKIETELFKLFGGVNKKYKEKGRSLLFNLKDRNNPELRERVMSGEIPPERLCSMTAEELASEELSQWRMAKAEEMAQMVVLPDTEVDIRRLVKKTHKGEFQVEVEQTDTATLYVSVGASSLDRNSAKADDGEASPSSKAAGMKEQSNAATAEKKSHLEAQEDACTITIPSSEGTDLMQGLMVDNELKDAEFLPPIVSLDEFMESLNAEPPFEDLPRDVEKSTHILVKDNTKVGSEAKSPVQTSQDPPDSTPAKCDNGTISDAKPYTDMKPSDSPPKSEPTASVVVSKGELVWDGLLQLNVSVTASVIGIFKSGEKASSKEWPTFLEIKGRVKLDAFEKYLQELPMSRSRAVMILHIVGKEASPKSDCRNLSEVAESYVSDGRVGIAEPAHGVELYFCPPHSKTIELLSKILPKDQLDVLSAIDNGLIGVLVWKKAQLTSTISPKSAPQHKHSSKKHLSSRRHHDKDKDKDKDKDEDKMNASIISKPSMTQGRPTSYSQPPPEEDDDDEVPPGFGPPAGRDDDDLPEFNFSGGSTQNSSRVTPFHPHAQTPIRPVDQIRELIHKYGQPQVNPLDRRDIGISTQSWNDDDDDIPEWQPQAQPPVHSSYQRSHVVNHQHQHAGMMQSHQQYRQPATILQPQMNVIQPQQQNSWTHGTYMVQPSQSGGVQYYGSVGPGGAGQPGVAWRQDASKSRGF